MKKLIVLSLVAILAVSLIGTADAKKKKKKKKPPAPVSVDQTYYMRRDGCGSDDDNTRLSVEDAADVGCWAADAGLLYEAVDQLAGAGAPFNPEVLWEPYPTADGVLPVTLDTTKPITGEITFYGGSCVVDPACSPAGVSVGQATVRIRVNGLVGEEVTEIGMYEETFTATPGATHTVVLEVQPDSELAGKAFDSIEVAVFKGGIAYGPGGIEYEDPASFVVIPQIVQPQ